MSKSTNRKNVENSDEENTMSNEECEARAVEKGCAEAGAHRCDQHGEHGNEAQHSKEWIDKQTTGNRSQSAEDARRSTTSEEQNS